MQAHHKTTRVFGKDIKERHRAAVGAKHPIAREESHVKQIARVAKRREVY